MRRFMDDEPRIAAWDLISRRYIAEAPLPQCGGVGYSLVGHPEGEAMAAVASAGRVTTGCSGLITPAVACVYEHPEMEDVAFPRFRPTGRELAQLMSAWVSAGGAGSRRDRSLSASCRSRHFRQPEAHSIRASFSC